MTGEPEALGYLQSKSYVEPRLSPNGRWLAYSKSMTAWRIFSRKLSQARRPVAGFNGGRLASPQVVARWQGIVLPECQRGAHVGATVKGRLPRRSALQWPFSLRRF